jgi:hyperosmotically inducible protein
MLKLTTKGRLILGIVLFLTLTGTGLYVYTRSTGLTLSQIWNQLTSASAPSAPKDTPVVSDTEIKLRLLEAILNDAQLRGQNVAVTVSKGVVVLSGEVAAAQQKEALETVARQTSGVQQVINNMTVTPPATSNSVSSTGGLDADEQLAKLVEFALYKTDAFDLKLMTITSRSGIVRLSGSARNRAEKLLAERLTREVEGVKEVVNELSVTKPDQ